MAKPILNEDDSAGGEGEEGEVKEEGNSVLTGDENSDDKNEDDAGDKEASDEAVNKDGDTDDKSEDGDADKDEAGAPDKYEQFVVPEGVEINPEVLEEFTPVLKEMGASQVQAQKLVDLQLKLNQQSGEAQATQWAEIRAGWKESGESDKEYGKGKYDASIVIARKAMRTVGTPELGKALEDTGMGDHPEFIRFFYRVGKAIGEDSLSFGNVGGGAPKTAADRIFPNQGKG
jgi:hypothetical protein